MKKKSFYFMLLFCIFVGINACEGKVSAKAYVYLPDGCLFDSQNIVYQKNGTECTVVGYDKYEYRYNIVIPENITDDDGVTYKVTKIQETAFQDAFLLKSVTIPKTVTEIGDAAFAGCMYLSNLSVSTANKVYCSDGKGNIYNKKKTILYIGNPSIDYFVLPKSVKTIHRFAFWKNSKLKKIIFTKNLVSIEESAFRNCDSLKQVSFKNGLKKIGKKAFAFCDLTKVVLPNSVTKIPDWCFWGNDRLKSVKFGNRLVKIGEESFAYCEQLEDITISSNKLNAIGEYAFWHCTSLKSVTIKSSKLNRIGKGAFCGDSRLISINLNTKKLSGKTVGKYAFSGTPDDLIIYVPKSKKKSYKRFMPEKGNPFVRVVGK